MKKHLVILLISFMVFNSCKKGNDEYRSPLGKKVSDFIKYKIKKEKKEEVIEYPYMVDSKENFLKDSTFIIHNSWTYVVAAYVPKGKSLKVVCYSASTTNLEYAGNWIMQNDGWSVTNNFPSSFTYEAQGDDKTVKIPFMCTVSKTLYFEIYENNAVAPTRIKTIVCQ